MGGDAHSYADLTVRAFLDALATRQPAPSAGAALGVSLATAAALTAMAARYAAPEFIGLADVADGLRHRSIALADADATAYAEVLRTRALPGDEPTRTTLITQAMKVATEIPCDLARMGVEVMDLAVRLAHEGNPNLVGDARAAAFQAASVTTSAADLVRINTRTEPSLRGLLHEASRHHKQSLDLCDRLR